MRETAASQIRLKRNKSTQIWERDTEFVSVKIPTTEALCGTQSVVSPLQQSFFPIISNRQIIAREGFHN